MLDAEMLNGRVNEMPKEEGFVLGRASLGFEETIGREALEKRKGAGRNMLRKYEQATRHRYL